MADGDTIIDDSWTVDANEGIRCKVLVIESSAHPPGYRYSFQLYKPEAGDVLVRYDNYHERDDIGWHHHHTQNCVSKLEPEPNDLSDVLELYRRFQTEELTSYD